MPKKVSTFKEAPLKDFEKKKKKPSLKKPLKESKTSLAIPNFDAIINNLEKADSKILLPESIYYDQKNPKSIDNSGFISRFEKLRIDLENSETNKFDSKKEALMRGLDEIYLFIKMEAGYRPIWFFDTIHEMLEKVGRPDIYSYDDRIFGSQFIHALMSYGSSKAQAINLLSILIGKSAVTTGFKREFSDTYNQYIEKKSTPEHPTISEIGQTISVAMTKLSLEKLHSSKDLIKQSRQALIKICADLIDHMRNNRSLVRKNDKNHEEIHSRVILLLNSQQEDPIQYFIQLISNEEAKKELHALARELRDYLHTIDYFSKNKNL